MMGRPRKRQITGHRNKAEKMARIGGNNVENTDVPPSLYDNLYDNETVELSIPDWLSDKAKAEFVRVAELLDEVSDLDVAVLAVYADAVDNYERLSSVIAKTGPVIVKKRVTGQVEVTANPAVAAQSEYVKRIMQCSLKLGLAVTDRMRLSAPKQEYVADAFAEFEGKV